MESLKEVFNLKITLLISTFLLIYLYLKKVVYSYWKSHGVPHDEPTLLLGTMKKEFLQKLTVGMSLQKSYEKFKSHPFHGIYIFTSPLLMITDADIIRDVLIKNFQYFDDRGMYHNAKTDPLTQNLFQLSSNRWRVLRTKFHSIFTPNKLKHMFPLINEITYELTSVLNENLINSDIIDVRDITSRCTIDVICSLFFGFNPNSLHDPNCEFRKYGYIAVNNRPLKNALIFFAPQILYIFRINYFNPKGSDFFIKLFKKVSNERKMLSKKRNDFLDLIIELMENKQEIEDTYNDGTDYEIKELASQPLTTMEATAQFFIFFIGGFETSSTIIGLLLYEISENPDVQKNLHREIDEFLQSSNELNMENLMKLEYLDMVVNETLRKHPPLPFLNRICVKDFQLSNSNYCIPKGMRIVITSYAIQRDPDIYPDPEKFDPTRFDETNSAARHPCHFLPFGEGPRHCIGKRFGVLQSKLIIFTLLSKYQFSICEKSEPIRYTRNLFLHTPDSSIYLRIQKRLH